MCTQLTTHVPLVSIVSLAYVFTDLSASEHHNPATSFVLLWLLPQIVNSYSRLVVRKQRGRKKGEKKVRILSIVNAGFFFFDTMEFIRSSIPGEREVEYTQLSRQEWNGQVNANVILLLFSRRTKL